ncbi:MAG: O-methyltransferase [Devosia sp.]
MSQIVWDDVDSYIGDKLIPHDRVMAGVLKANRAAGLPPIDVSPAQGKFLNLIVRMINARMVLEIGTLGGYSTIWMARGLGPHGRLITLEAEVLHATVARQNIADAGLSTVVEVRQGRAIDSLPKLRAEGLYPFDLIFIDADKASNAAYIDWGLRLSRPGTVIILDNMIRGGGITDGLSADASVRGAREAFDLLGSSTRLSATALQTVGSKGYDGFVMAIVES